MSSIYGNTYQTPAPTGIFRGTSKLRVESLILRMTGTFNDQFIRPYVTNPSLNNRDLERIASNIAQAAPNGNITPVAVSGVSGSFLTRSASAEAVAGIVNGWSMQRLRFIMKVSLVNAIGGSNTLFVTGYTDHAGVANGHLDPNMEFFVNNLYKVRSTFTQTPVGTNHILETVGSQQIITDHNRQQNRNAGFNNGNSDLKIMSPGDVFKALESSVLYNSAANNEYGSLVDTRFLVDYTGKTAAKGINNPNTYIAHTLNSYINGSSEDFQEPEHSAALKHYMRSNEFENQDFWRSEFFAAIDQFRNDYAMKSSSFSLKDIEKVDTNVRNVITFINDRPNELHSAGLTSYWNGQDLNTVTASIIASSLPTLMSEQLVSSVTITSTNSTLDGRPLTTIIHGTGFSNHMDMRQNFDRLRSAFEMLVVKDISFNNEIGYSVQISCDLIGQTKIKIRMDGCPEQDFVFPTFCDALFSPILTTNMDSILRVSEDFSHLMNFVKEAKYADTGTPQISKLVNF